MLKCKHITVVVTNSCNMKCKNCYVGQKKEYIDFSMFQRHILSEFINLGGESIGFSGGEPLLFSQINACIKTAAEVGLETSLVTNGILLTKEKAFELKTLGLSRVQISLDVGNREENDNLRQDGGFETVVKQAIPSAIAAGLRTTLVAVPNIYLMQGLKEYLDLAAELGVNAVYFRRRIEMGDNLLSEHTKETYYLFLQELESQKKNYNFPIFSGEPMQSVIRLKKEKRNIDKLFAGCSAGITSLAVQTNGTVYPCTRLPISLGNVRNEGLMSIWQKNSVLCELRLRRINGKCGSCQYKYVCGGCRAATYYQVHDYQGADPMCCI